MDVPVISFKPRVVVSETTATCPDHGEYIEKEMGYEGRTDTRKSGCPKCWDEALARHLEEEAQEEAKRKAKWRLERIIDMNIEPAFYEVTLDNFDAATPELEKNRDTVRALIGGGIKKIVMTGKNGTGKTHLACAALHVLGGRIMTMFEISATIRATYSSHSERTELGVLDELASVKLLVIDEIGRTKGGDAEENWISYIIDKRHTRGLPVILISNKHVKKDCPDKGCARCLENFISEDVMSRLSEGGILLRFSGDDYRRKEGRHGGDHD